MKPRNSLPHSSALLSCLAFGFFSAPAGYAVDYTWQGQHTGGQWQNANNWVGATTPTFNANADIFFYAAGAGRLGNFISANRTIGSLNFNDNVTSAVNIRLATTNTGGTAANLTMGSSTVTPSMNVSSVASANINIGQSDGSFILLNNLTVNHSGNGMLTLSRPITQSGGPHSLSKTGTGTLILSASNTYTGTTIINGGTLTLTATGSIDNSSKVTLGGGTFDVSAKTGGYTLGNLSGSGTVLGALTISTELAIGASPGTINFADLTLGSSASYVFDLTEGGTAADLANVSGTLTLNNATLDLVQLGTYTIGEKFTLFAFAAGNLAGTFSGLADGATFTGGGGLWQIDYNDTTAGFNGGTGTRFVTITAIPEPSAALLGAIGMLGLLRRRRSSRFPHD